MRGRSGARILGNMRGCTRTPHTTEIATWMSNLTEIRELFITVVSLCTVNAP
jgi:hypothetical protein